MTRQRSTLMGGFFAATIALAGGCAGFTLPDTTQEEPFSSRVSSEVPLDADSAVPRPGGDSEELVRIPPSDGGTTDAVSSSSGFSAPTLTGAAAPANSDFPATSPDNPFETDVARSGASHSRIDPTSQFQPAGQRTKNSTSSLNSESYEAASTAGPPTPRGDEYPIDLANALAMGGANHLQIQIARQRVVEAHANWVRAAAIWIPDLRFGIAWTRHDGQIQATEGQVVDVARSSLFVGGGVGYGGFPLTGGAGGPARLMVNLSLADAIFERPVAERQLAAASAGEGTTTNDSLRDIGIAYFGLVEAYSLLANAGVGLELSSAMVKLTTLFEEQGAGSEAAVDLAKTEEAFWRQAVQEAQRLAFARAADLARLIRVNSHLKLIPADEVSVPVHLLDPAMPCQELVAMGFAARPELARQEALVAAAMQRTRQEHWRPLLPNLHVGASGGTFGGGRGSDFNSQASRGDVDLLAVWELKNSGFGVYAQREMRASQLVQARIQIDWLRDQVAAEIITAANDVGNYQLQIDTALQSVKAAQQSYDRNFQRVRAGEGLPIELLQAIRARANALNAHTRAIADYNRAQCRLLRAVGRPLDQINVTESPTPAPETVIPASVPPETAQSTIWRRY